MTHGIRRAAVAAIGAIALLAVAQPAWALTEAPDQTWGVKGKVYALARVGDTLFVGGTFKKAVSPTGTKVKVPNLAAFDIPTGNLVTSFTPTVASSTTAGVQVRALDVSADGTRLYVGGKFDLLDGATVSNFGAVDTATGALASGFDAPSVKKPVNALLVGPSLVYLGGDLTKVDGTARGKLAAVAFDGSLDPNWTPSANDTVRSFTFAADGNSIFIGGKYTMMNGQPRNSVARVSTDTGALNAWAIPSGVIDSGNPAWDIIATPTRLYGGFGNGPNYLASFRLDNGNIGSQVWRYSTVGNVESLALSPNGSRLFFGGHFGTGRLQQSVCGGRYLRGLASVNPGTGQLDCTWIPQLEPHGANFKGAWALLQTGSHLWAGGFFTSISGVAQSSLARFTL